jgi:hypothetical protein
MRTQRGKVENIRATIGWTERMSLSITFGDMTNHEREWRRCLFGNRLFTLSEPVGALQLRYSGRKFGQSRQTSARPRQGSRDVLLPR